MGGVRYSGSTCTKDVGVYPEMQRNEEGESKDTWYDHEAASLHNFKKSPQRNAVYQVSRVSS